MDSSANFTFVPESHGSHADATQRLDDALADFVAGVRRMYADAAGQVAPGLPPSAYKLLLTISRIGPVSLSTLVERFASDKGQMSRQVRDLETLGLVERTADSSDGRIRLIAMTPLGIARMTAARAPYRQQLAAVLSDRSPESISDLAELLQALTRRGITPPH
ncbi:MarR family winged helix-turn-helix transcriptional regulator [Microbacterium suwonense]|uniref:HTH marR-type domain-containing protein n=1 Tax=Microbacterium suwonense TaxID=683047 RepID=A0ABN6X4M5_9MICO|nr:MarR family transcriptional regulator [Microbacterium suwonense]BDZ39519.1 hypothetical protein GCM10025863_21330 [Microbacterium suwonense]